jgi:hypothetical protein
MPEMTITALGNPALSIMLAGLVYGRINPRHGNQLFVIMKIRISPPISMRKFVAVFSPIPRREVMISMSSPISERHNSTIMAVSSFRWPSRWIITSAFCLRISYLEGLVVPIEERTAWIMASVVFLVSTIISTLSPITVKCVGIIYDMALDGFL